MGTLSVVLVLISVFIRLWSGLLMSTPQLHLDRDTFISLLRPSPPFLYMYGNKYITMGDPLPNLLGMKYLVSGLRVV